MVQDVTRRVLEKINEKMDYKGSFKKIALIAITGSNINLGDRLEELKKLKSKGTELSLAFSFMAERIVDVDYIVKQLSPIYIYKEEDVFQLEDVVNKHHALIGPNISTNTLSKVSLGIIDSFIPLLVWAFLHRKKPVYLDFTSVRNFLSYKSHNDRMNTVVENHIKTVKDMGAVELIPGRYVEAVDNKGSVSTPSVDKKVITERDLKELGEGSRVVLPKGTIITPLAKDKAKLLGITLEVQK